MDVNIKKKKNRFLCLVELCQVTECCPNFFANLANRVCIQVDEQFPSNNV